MERTDEKIMERLGLAILVGIYARITSPCVLVGFISGTIALNIYCKILTNSLNLPYDNFLYIFSYFS